jgi:hypothetical protein
MLDGSGLRYVFERSHPFRRLDAITPFAALFAAMACCHGSGDGRMMKRATGGCGGAVLACAAGGCGDAPTTVTSGLIAPTEIAVDAAHLYVTEYGTGARDGRVVVLAPP